MTLFIFVLILFLLFYRLRKKTIYSNVKHIFVIFVTCFLVIHIIKYPEAAFSSAKLGVDTWFNIVFPALLPFFVGAEMLIGLGVVNFIGILLEPIIRPIFNVPGEGSFILAMSITSGYPIGAKLITDLRSKRAFSKTEAQRLLSFCSTSGPLFMIGAVAIGMFHNAQLGTTIALAHYLGALMVGILFRFYKFRNNPQIPHKTKNGYIKRAFKELFHSIQNSEKTFGALLGTAVKNAVETLLTVGGFIILFSVIIRLLTLMGFIKTLSYYLQNFLFFFQLDKNACAAIISGVFEMTIGCKLLSEIDGISFIKQAVFATMLISWSGFSIHAQVANLISKTDLSASIYIFSKFLHALFSGIFILLVVPFTNTIFKHIDTPAFLQYSKEVIHPTWTSKILLSSELFLSITILIMILAMILQILYKITYLFSFHKK
ncbi:sporulation integral membrane protein YlbJ [Crassaminicella profunda]|uniref:sporulation integral membrane protein YlbJ n=1 Tax=Crassaminicella profunda TaxID=1286698 RepID=UPI001CA727E2|nr:sporulation integral membrane protein YlbJ [Crassaminicella profunda]QZY57107.1 sporulation integral membrane protein YlbJ [Crassaminicella profunda]